MGSQVMRWGWRGRGVAVEVGEGDAGGGEGGDFAVLEEVDVAGVVEDAGDVGGEEEFAVAEAEDGGRAHAGGDQLVGFGGGEHADGEGAGEAGYGAADCFFEGEKGRGGRVEDGLGTRWSRRCGCRGRGLRRAASSSSSWMTWAMISVSVSEGNLWPLAMRAVLSWR